MSERREKEQRGDTEIEGKAIRERARQSGPWLPVVENLWRVHRRRDNLLFLNPDLAPLDRLSLFLYKYNNFHWNPRNFIVSIFHGS
jgi:hypothetical protein